MNPVKLQKVRVDLGSCIDNWTVKKQKGRAINVFTTVWTPQVPYKGATYPVYVDKEDIKPTPPVKHHFNLSKRKQYEADMAVFDQSKAIYDKLKYVIGQAKYKYGRHLYSNKYEIIPLGIEVEFSVDVGNLQRHAGQNQVFDVRITSKGLERIEQLFKEFKALDEASLARQAVSLRVQDDYAKSLQVARQKQSGR